MSTRNRLTHSLLLPQRARTTAEPTKRTLNPTFQKRLLNIQIRNHTKASGGNTTTTGTNQNKAAARCTPLYPRQRATSPPLPSTHHAHTKPLHNRWHQAEQGSKVRPSSGNEQRTRRSCQRTTGTPQGRQIEKAVGLVPCAGAPGRRSSVWGRARGRRRRRRMRRLAVPGTPCGAAVLGGCGTVCFLRGWLCGGQRIRKGREAKRSDDGRGREGGGGVGEE
jgi:hypothetical protein